MPVSALRHIHDRRDCLQRELPVQAEFAAWEETCIPSYCHPNLAAAYLSWWRLYAAVALARRHACFDAVLDFGAAVGELRRLLPVSTGRYDFIEQNDRAASYLSQQFAGAVRETLDSAPAGGYSCIFALDALEHNTDFAALLTRLAGKLAPGGVFIMSGPTENRLYRLGRRIAGFDAHYHETNIYAIEAAARARMTPVEVRQLPPLLPLFRLSAWRPGASVAG